MVDSDHPFQPCDPTLDRYGIAYDGVAGMVMDPKRERFWMDKVLFKDEEKIMCFGEK